VVVLFDRHFEVEADKFGEMAMGVGVFGPEDWQVLACLVRDIMQVVWDVKDCGMSIEVYVRPFVMHIVTLSRGSRPLTGSLHEKVQLTRRNLIHPFHVTSDTHLLGQLRTLSEVSSS
jgi:hypothetical protein